MRAFRATSLFLCLTSALKIVSSLGEAKVLAVADPLVAFLTTRQMLFLAAALELLVAAFLWSERFDRYRPWLTLWLVSLFVTYRVGLISIGYHGPCSCLGNIFEWFPSLEKWASPMMWAALVCMFLTSAGSLWHDFTFKRPTEEPLPTPDPVPNARHSS